MIDSVPSMALGSPPETGASIIWIPALVAGILTTMFGAQEARIFACSIIYSASPVLLGFVCAQT